MNQILSSSLITLSLAMASVNLYANDKVVQRDTSKVTHIQEIRNATIKVTYADTTFLIDPMFAKKGFYEVAKCYLIGPIETLILIVSIN